MISCQTDVMGSLQQATLQQNDIQGKQHTNDAIVPVHCTRQPRHSDSKEGSH